MPEGPDDNSQTLQEQIDYLMSQVTMIKAQKSRSLSAIGNQIMLQSGTITTTLSAAITTPQQTSITVAAAINITNGTSMQIDDEIVTVTAGGTTTSLTILRGQFGTAPTIHSSGAVVDNSLVPYLFPGNPFNQIPERINVDATFVGGGGTIIGTCHGIYESPKPTTNNIARQIYEFAILNAATGSQAAYPLLATSLSAAITSSTATSISVASGAGIANGDYVTVGPDATYPAEIMRVLSGGGTTTLTVARANNIVLPGPSAFNLPVHHLNGAPVNKIPFGFVIYFLIGANGWRARIYATAQYTVVLCNQIGSGIAATVNFTMESVL